MSKLLKVTSKLRVFTGMLAIALCVAMCSESLGFVSLADRQGVITASAAKIREDASSSSEQVGRVEEDTKVTVLGEKKGADGYTWYEISADGVTGYVRSDLIEVDEAEAEVTKVEATAAKVSGDSKVRVRANASTSSDTVASIPAETALTVTGKATASDGKLWYEINCIVNGEQIDGFIRSDYVEMEEEPADVAEPTPTEEPAAPAEPDAPYYIKDQEGVWFLVENNVDGEDVGWEIQSLFDGIEKNAEAYNNSQKTVKSQRTVIIILAFLLVAAAAGIGFLLFKVRDLNDAGYYEDAEEEELRRKDAVKARSNAVVMHTIGEDAPARPQRPAAPQGARPVAPQGARPAAPQGTRPAAPQGTRPVAPQGARPAAPQGTRPVAPQGARPAAPQSARPAAPQGTRPAAPQGARPAAPQSERPAQPKNFMAEDDEFDFEFLNFEDDK